MEYHTAMGIQNYLPLTLVDLVNVQELLALFLTCPFLKMQLDKLTIFDSQEKKRGGGGGRRALPGCSAAVAHLARLALSSLLGNGHRSLIHINCINSKKMHT